MVLKDMISNFRFALLGCRLADFLKIRICVFMRKIRTTKRPGYLHDILVRVSFQIISSLHLPRFKYLNSSRLFFVQAIRVWNSLHPDIKINNSSNNFENAVKNHFNRY